MHLLAYLFILSFTTIVSALYFDTPPAATTNQGFIVGWHRDTSDPQQVDLWLANDADQTLAHLGNLDSKGQPQGTISVTITRSGTWRIIVPFGPNPTYTQGNKASSASIHVLDAPAATTQSPATQSTPTDTPTTHNQAATSTSSSVQSTKTSTTGSPSNTDSSSSHTTSGSASTTTSGSTNTDDQQSSQESTQTTNSSPTSFPSSATHPGTGVLNGPGTGTDSSDSSTTTSPSDPNNTSPNVSGDTSTSNTTTIVAVVVGVLAGLVLLVTLFVICVRRARARRNRETVVFYRDRMVRGVNDIPPRPSEETSNPRFMTPSPDMNEARQSFLSMGGAAEYVGHAV